MPDAPEGTQDFQSRLEAAFKPKQETAPAETEQLQSKLEAAFKPPAETAAPNLQAQLEAAFTAPMPKPAGEQIIPSAGEEPPKGPLPQGIAPSAKPQTTPSEDAKYETKLNPEKEAEFQKWFEDQRTQGNITKGDYDFYKQNGYGAGYDFRAAFDKGLQASENGHWNDYGKKPSHETFSDESKYANEPGAKPGRWEGDQFIPYQPQDLSGQVQPEFTPAPGIPQEVSPGQKLFNAAVDELTPPKVELSPTRSPLARAVDWVTAQAGVGIADVAPEAATAIGAVHGFDPGALTPQDKAQMQKGVENVLLPAARSYLQGRTWGLYQAPELTPEQKALGGEYIQAAAWMLGAGKPIKQVAGVVGAEGIVGWRAAAVTGLIFDIMETLGSTAGKWLAGEPQTPPSPGALGLTGASIANYLGAPGVATEIAKLSAQYRPIDTAFTFGLAALGFDKIIKPLARAFGFSLNPTYEEWLGKHIQQGMEEDLVKGWQAANPQAGGIVNGEWQAGRPSKSSLAEWYQKLDPDAQAKIVANSQFFGEMQQHAEQMRWQAKPLEAKKAPAQATPMETGAEEATKTAEIPKLPPPEEGAPPPVTERPPAKPTPPPTVMGNLGSEVGAVAESRPPSVEGVTGPPTEAAPAVQLPPGPPIGVTGDGLAVAEVKPAPVTPAPEPTHEEIAPQTMAQSSAPANVEPVTPGRNTFAETPVQTRENKITEHEEIAQQTKINAVTFKRFQDFVEAKDWPKVQEELHLSSANFTQAAFDHHFNPLQLMGRLEEGGMSHPEAKALVKEYEQQAYAPMRTEMGVRGGTFRQSPVVGMQDLLKTEPPAEGGPHVQSSMKAAKEGVVPPQRDEFLAAIKDTPGAEITPDGLKIKLARRQKPEQAGKESVRTGVFYLPEGASTLRHYGGKSTGLPSWYGGPQKIAAEAVFKNPIVEKGGTGGMVPERVYDALMGKGAMKQLSDDIGTAMKEWEWKPRLDKWQEAKVTELRDKRHALMNQEMTKPSSDRDFTEYNRLNEQIQQIIHSAPRDTNLKNIKNLLKQYGGDPKAALWIVENSKAGNQLRYALQEHIIAHAVRAAGHDGVIGYNRSKGTFKMTEIFDVRQGQYPTNTGQVFSQFPKFYKAHPVEKPAFTVKGVTTHMPILEQDGDRVVERPGSKVQNSLKQARELAPIYYSQMSKFLKDKLPGKGTGEDLSKLVEGWAGLKEVGRNKNDVPIFSKAEFKQDELKWSGLLPWLKEQKGIITKPAIVQFLKDNPTEVGDVVRGEPPEISRSRQAAVRAGDDFQEASVKIFGALAEKGVPTHDINMVLDDISGDNRELQISAHDFMQRKLPEYDLGPLVDAAERVRVNREMGFPPEAKYQSYVMEGPYENYRERLSTLPGLKSADYTKWQAMIAKMQAKYGPTFGADMTAVERATLARLHQLAGHGSGAVFKGAHWPEPNVVVHTRGANRVDVDGKKAYVLEENQGDWHQQGRKEGYVQAPEVISKLRIERGETDRKVKKVLQQIEDLREERMALGKEAESGIPAPPPQKHKWEKKNITISFDGAPDGKLEIPAEVLGNFAVHKNVTQGYNDERPKFGRDWRVTHLHTGLIASGPKLDFKSLRVKKTQALKFAEYIQEHGKADWTFRDLNGFKGTNQELGKDDLARAAVAAGLIRPNAIGESGEPAPVRPGWSTEHKQRAAELDEKIGAAKTDRLALSYLVDDISGRLHRAEKGIANAPFSKTWPELGMKRALREAAEDPTIERLEWTAGEVQFERWGSERIDWKKGAQALTFAEEEEYERLKTMDNRRPLEGRQAEQLKEYRQRQAGATPGGGWTVAAKEQHGGFAGGVDIEQTARDRGKLLEERGKKISTKEELDRIVKQTLSRERNNEEMSKLTDRLWERMQTEEEGTSLPRKEGMEAFYDKMLPTFMGKYVKQWGGTVGKTAVPGESKASWVIEHDPEVTGLYVIRGHRGIVTNHDLREAGIERARSFNRATFETNADAIAMAKRLFGEYNQNTKQYPVWYVDITPEMRESVLYQGQQQFRLKEAGNVQAQAAAADRAIRATGGIPEGSRLPQAGEGTRRELETFQSLYRGEKPDGGSTSAWPALRYSDELAAKPEFQAFVTMAHAEGIDLVIPVQGHVVNAQIISDRGKNTILIDADHDLNKTITQLGKHEVAHHKIDRGDEDMKRLITRVDTGSTAFKLYRESLEIAADAIGGKYLSKTQAIYEIVADYWAGIHNIDFGEGSFNIASAFRPAGQPQPTFLRTLFGRPAAMAASARAPPNIQASLRRAPKKPPKAPEDILVDKYKLAKVANVGGKNWAKEQARRLEAKHMDMIREAVGEKKVGPKTIEMGKVLTNFIDHFREPEHLAKFYHDQPAEVQRWLDKFAKVSDDPDLMTIVDKLKGAGEALATEAYDEQVIREAFENHQNRIYKEEGRPGHMAGAKYATATGHAKKRFYATRLEARAPIEKGGGGKTFKVEGVAENLRIMTEEIKKVIENRRMTARGLNEGWLSTDQHEGWQPAPWPQMYKRTWQFKVDADSIIREIKNVATEIKNSTTSSTTTTGGPAPGAAATGGSTSGPVQKMIDVITNSLEVRGVTPEEAKTYVRRVQEAAIRAAQGAPATPPPEGTPPPETITTIIKEVRDTLTTLETKQEVVGHRFGEVRRANMYMDTDGNVFSKVPVFGPTEVTKDLHNMFSTQDISPVLEKVQQYNAVAKAGTLALSPFHLFAYGRNLLAVPGFMKMIHPVGYYKKGKALGEASHRDTEWLIRGGLVTFSGMPPDWSELAEDRRTGLGELMGKNALTRKTRDAFWNLIAYNSSFIFEKVGNAYKLQFAHDILAHLRNKYPDLTPEQQYYYAADHANDVFGGRNEEISGKLFGDRLASSAKARVWSRLFILARDWTMSNLKLFKRAFDRGPSGHLARQYWGYALAKIFSAVIAANLLVSLIDDRSAWQSFKDAWRDPKQLRWLDVNITPFYKLAAKMAGYTPTDARKYLRVGGHFYDAFKMIINPVQFFHHKQSVLARFFWEGLTGQDWRGNVFTTLNEMLGVTDSIAGPLTGQLTKEGKSTGAIGYAQMPSFLLHQVRGVIPIPGQNLLYALTGEMDGFTAAIKAGGGMASSATPKTEAQQLIGEYYQNVSPTIKSAAQKGRTDLKKELLKMYKDGDTDGFRNGLEDAIRDGKISHQEAQEWANEAPLPKGVQSFVKLPMDMAIKAMGEATDEEKDLWMPYFLRKVSLAKPDTLMNNQGMLVELLRGNGANDNADVIEALQRPNELKTLNIPEPAEAEMNRLDMLQNLGVLDDFTAGLLRKQALAKPRKANPLRALGVSSRGQDIGKQRSTLSKMLGLR